MKKGQTHSRDSRAAIGAGVRAGAANKVPFSTRIDPAIAASFRAKAKRRATPISVATEEAMKKW